MAAHSENLMVDLKALRLAVTLGEHLVAALEWSLADQMVEMMADRLVQMKVGQLAHSLVEH